MGVATAAPRGLAKVGLHVADLLSDGQQNAAICVISDSTGLDLGAGNDRRWVFYMAQKLAAQFPAYTVNHRLWNDTNTNYDAPTVIQTGNGTANAGGPFVLDVYAACKGGASAGYWIPKLDGLNPPGAVFPVDMDLIIIADGHNEIGVGGGNVALMRKTFYQFHRAVEQLQPVAQIAWLTQNPQNGAGSSSSPAEQANQLARQSEVRRLARAEGLGLIDITPIFLADSNYAGDLLLSDGIHPNVAGSTVWANEVMQHLPANRDRNGPQVGGPVSKVVRLWIPATAFQLVSGGPAPLTIVQSVPTIGLPTAVDTVLAATTDLPIAWRSINSWIYWTQTTGSANNFVMQQGSQPIGGTMEPSNSAGPLLGSQISHTPTQTIAGRATANTVGVGSLVLGAFPVASYPGRPVSFQVERHGTNGSDVQANSIFLIGLLLERGS